MENAKDTRGEVVADSTGRPDRKVKNVEIHPIEWDARIVLSGGRPIATLPIDQVRDVSVVSRPKGIIKKKEDLTVKITFTGNDALEHWIIINIDDRYIKEFLDHIEKLRQKESDATYWTHRLLIFQTGPRLENETDDNVVDSMKRLHDQKYDSLLTDNGSQFNRKNSYEKIL